MPMRAVAVAVVLTVVGMAPPAMGVPDGAESQFVALVDEARAHAGLPPLAVLPVLRDMGRQHSARMAESGTLHHSLDLRSAVTAHVPDWRRVGENVGTGGDVASLHEAFMRSDTHRANVLGDFEHIGVGVVDADGVIWVTVLFVAHAPTVEIVRWPDLRPWSCRVGWCPSPAGWP